MIEWNRVTWYSQTAAVVIGIAIFSVAFYFGRASSLRPNDLSLQATSSPESLGQSLQPIGGTGDNGEWPSSYMTDGKDVYYLMLDVQPQDFELLKGSLRESDNVSYDYARDSNNVYYEGEPLGDTAIASFTPLENGNWVQSYGTDGTSVYYGATLIPGADPMTFKILWQTVYEGCGLAPYSKDATHVYYMASVIPGADPRTFTALINGYGKDSRGYYKGSMYIGPTLNPQELVCNYG